MTWGGRILLDFAVNKAILKEKRDEVAHVYVASRVTIGIHL